MKNKTVICPECAQPSETDDIIKSCGNCFACVGCEIYICPHCGTEIVIKALPKQ